jgi:hypothetical protein
MIGNELLKTAQTYLNPCLVKPKIHFNTKMWSEVLDFFENPIWFS